jgi:hypothetical protein
MNIMAEIMLYGVKISVKKIVPQRSGVNVQVLPSPWVQKLTLL